MLMQKTLSLEEAQRCIAAVIEAAKKGNRRLAVAVVDKSGDLIACARMDGRAARFLKAAHRKAYTAAAFEMNTSGVLNFWKRQEEQGHRGPADWNDPMLTTLPGGLVVIHDDKVVGAIAVAGGGGGPGNSDWDFAEIGFRALGEGFRHSDVMHQDTPVYG